MSTSSSLLTKIWRVSPPSRLSALPVGPYGLADRRFGRTSISMCSRGNSLRFLGLTARASRPW